MGLTRNPPTIQKPKQTSQLSKPILYRQHQYLELQLLVPRGRQVCIFFSEVNDIDHCMQETMIGSADKHVPWK